VKGEVAILPVPGEKAPGTGLNPWVKLLIGVAAVLCFIFGGGRLAALLPGAERMARTIEERGLRATAVFYTDLEESAEGAESIRNSLEYPPGSRP